MTLLKRMITPQKNHFDQLQRKDAALTSFRKEPDTKSNLWGVTIIASFKIPSLQFKPDWSPPNKEI